MPFSPLPDILEDLRHGKMVILTDDESRENEGDLVLPAQFVTPEAITFMLSVARGYLCLSLTEADCDKLELHPQATRNTTVRGTAFTVSIDLHPKFGGTTGVSARERARCIQLAIEPNSSAKDFVRPGHINPLRSRDGGVLVRTGQTEGSLDLCRLAGLYPAAAIIEIMRDDGEMARLPDLVSLAQKHGIRLCSVAQIIEHRLSQESLVRRIPPREGRPLRTALGEFNLIAFESLVDPMAHLALTVGGVGRLGEDGRVIEQIEPTLVRMHRRHLLGDVFGDLSSSPDGASGESLRASMEAIQRAGRGAVVYLRTMPGASDELERMLQSPRRAWQAEQWAGDPARRTEDDPSDSMPAPLREFGIGCQILRDLGLRNLRLLTQHARPLPAIEAYELRIVEHVRPDMVAGPG